MQRLTYVDTVLLCAAIIEQAVDDYKTLRKKKKAEVKNKDEGDYGISEIEDFFLGEWGDAIIHDGLRLKMLDGADFIKAASL